MLPRRIGDGLPWRTREQSRYQGKKGNTTENHKGILVRGNLRGLAQITPQRGQRLAAGFAPPNARLHQRLCDGPSDLADTGVQQLMRLSQGSCMRHQAALHQHTSQGSPEGTAKAAMNAIQSGTHTQALRW